MADRRSSTGILIGIIVGAAVVLVALVGFAVASRSDDGPTASDPTTTTTTAAADRPAPTTSSEPGASTTTAAAADVDIVDHSVQAGIIRREYLVVSPKRVEPGTRLPVVMALHGLGQDRNAMLNAADWRGAVERDRFIAVFPQGFANSWNMGSCCPPASLLAIDDQAFLDQVVGELTARPDVDPQRLYLSGFSNGAMMAYSAVCARPGVYAALGTISGSNISGCTPSEPISLLHQHGDPDPVVPFDGQPSLTQLLSSADFPPVPATIAAWAAADRCATPPEVTTESSGVERSTWSPCQDGTEVELVRLPGLGHAWPNMGEYRGLDSMLAFFGIG